MMDRLREGVNSIAVKIILGLIILSFVFAGVGNYIIGGSGNAAAKVGNTEIGRGAFEQAYQSERNRMQAQMGDYFSNLLADPAYVQSFRKSVLDRMINEVLLEQYAASLGLRISDEQVRNEILNMEPFLNDGKFDQDIYQAALRRAGYTVDSFAEYLRRDLTRQQVRAAVQNSVFSLSNEVAALSQLITQKRDIQTITLMLDDFARRVELTDEELQTYYDTHQANYTRPEQMKVAYLELSAEALKEQVSVSEKEAQQYYAEQISKYTTQEQRQLSHILVEGDDEAKAQSILDELNSGADFTALAKAKSEDVGSAQEGGLLGWIEKGVMDPAFEEAAFALEKTGDTTGLVKSSFGYHIIRLDAIRAAQAKPYDQVADEIKSDIAEQKAVERFYELQTELETVAFEYPNSLDDAAKAVALPVQNTDFISLDDAPESLSSAAVLQALGSAEVKDDRLNSEVIEIAPEHVVVVRINDLRDEAVLPFDEVKPLVVTELSDAKGEQQAKELAVKVMDELKAGNDAVLAEHNLAWGETESVDRGSELSSAVFAMPKPEEGKAVYSQTTDMQGNVVLIALSAVSTDIEPMYTEQIGSQLVSAEGQQDLTVLMKDLREKADIEYYAISTQP
ncbi:peptidylprolyl isomerase [Vibrio sp. HA2012]|uniref:peptidylprolyl isomerase n=1 Tax=Vibrio sp. HA2012 TaxID=1971595 RepID=UPI000C2B6D7F|nr:peptidylprolyl isomerase [Vibrio sp. HA2012]PJC85387.1 peptidylprolyl isomerase [Vibrio sp. HA2012]